MGWGSSVAGRSFRGARPKAFPWGEGAPVRTLGRMRGSFAVWFAPPSGCSLSWGATSSGQSPHRSPRPDGQVSLRSLAPPLPRKALRAFPGPPDCAPNHVYGHCHPVMWKDGGDGSKTISFSLPEKETVFGIQRKRGSRGGQVAPNRVSAAPLYAPVEDQPHPQWTTQAEQGQAVVLSDIFSPPARVGVGRGAAAWYSLYRGAQRRLFYRFTLHYYLFPLIVGRGFPDALPGTTPQSSSCPPSSVICFANATFPLKGGR